MIYKYTIPELEIIANKIYKSGLFQNIKSPEQAFSIMFIGQSEDVDAAQSVLRYNVILGRLAKNADALLTDYIRLGGKVKWIQYEDDVCEAEFTYQSTGTIKIKWDIDRSKRAGLYNKIGDMYKKYPRQMLSSRVISEGVHKSNPSVCQGLYTPEEVMDFDNNPKEIGIQKSNVKTGHVELNAEKKSVKCDDVKLDIETKTTELNEKIEFEKSSSESTYLLDEYNKLKNSIGDELYYKFMGGQGYSHANEIPPAKRENILKEMIVFSDMACPKSEDNSDNKDNKCEKCGSKIKNTVIAEKYKEKTGKFYCQNCRSKN